MNSVRVERSYLVRIVQTYDVTLTEEQRADLYECDEHIIESGALVSDDFESIDYDDLTLGVVEAPEHRTTARARTLRTRLAELAEVLGEVVPANVAHYAVEDTRRAIETLRRELDNRPEGVVGGDAAV